MGKIVVRAQQQKVYNLGGSGGSANAYVLRPVRYTTMTADDIVSYCATNSIVPKAYMSAAMVALAQCIENFLLNGHSVEFPSLGIFSLSSNGISESDVTKAGIAQLNKLKIRFLPCTKLKTEVENVSLQMDGVYDIAGETVIEAATATTPAKTVKYYKKVVATESSSSGSGSGSDNSGNSGNSGNTTPTTYSVTLSASPAAGGSVGSDQSSVTAGDSVHISATANSGYTFSKWSDNNTSASRDITVNSNITLQAIFVANSDEGGGSSDDGGNDSYN